MNENTHDRNAGARSVADIVRDLLAETTFLLRKETQLARVEVSEKVDQAIQGLLLLGAAVILLIPAVTILLAAAVAAIVDAGVVEVRAAALGVGGAALLLGVALGWIGTRAVMAHRLMPHRTLRRLQRDVLLGRNQLSRDHGVERAA
jgi:uncharacterized membrane protein YqjE